MKPHVIIFPFLAQGHTLPLIDLSKAFSSRNIDVTIITTPSNFISITPYLAQHPSINLIQFPFDSTLYGLPKGCENSSQLPSMHMFVPFLESTKQLQKPLKQLLTRLSESKTLPICLVSDFFLGWTLETCREFDVPRIVFHGMGVLSMLIIKTVWVNPHLVPESESEAIELNDIELPFVLTKADLPKPYKADPKDMLWQYISIECVETDLDSWGVIVNSFEELEGSYFSGFESLYRNGAKVWALGPLFLHGSCSEERSNGKVMDWLDGQETEGSVIYVSFGTQAEVSDMQLDEVAYGLEESGYAFILVVKSQTWLPPGRIETSIKGLITRNWVNQRDILFHKAIGGFLSHCGWNSVLEGVGASLPILAMPFMAEQPVNAQFVVDGLGLGIRVKMGSSLVSREAISEGVKELMGGENGRKARERAKSLSKMANGATQEGGSSHGTLTKLIDELCALKSE